jgi:hypothetical protein
MEQRASAAAAHVAGTTVPRASPKRVLNFGKPVAKHPSVSMFPFCISVFALCTRHAHCQLLTVGALCPLCLFLCQWLPTVCCGRCCE